MDCARQPKPDDGDNQSLPQSGYSRHRPNDKGLSNLIENFARLRTPEIAFVQVAFNALEF